VTFLLDGKSCRNGGPDIIEVQQHPIAQAFRETAIVLGEDAAPDVFDESQPTGDKVRLVLFDEPHGFDDVEDQHRSIGSHGSSEGLVRSLANLHRKNLATLFMAAPWRSWNNRDVGNLFCLTLMQNGPV
jgi:hypothetical protein